LFEKKPTQQSDIQHKNKPVVRLSTAARKEVAPNLFTLDVKGTEVVHVLTQSAFKLLLSDYFVAVDYLLHLWLEHPFNLIITDDLKKHFGKDISIEGFIRYSEIPDIYIRAKTTKKHRTGIILHEIGHQLAYLEAKSKNVQIKSHGKEFKRHLRLLFAPLLIDKTFYKKNEELIYHLRYETRRYSPAKDLCV
jgi:hypothetical protein